VELRSHFSLFQGSTYEANCAFCAFTPTCITPLIDDCQNPIVSSDYFRARLCHQITSGAQSDTHFKNQVRTHDPDLTTTNRTFVTHTFHYS